MNANIPRAIALLDVLISKSGDPDYTDEALRTVVLRYASQARDELDNGGTTVRRWRPIVIGVAAIAVLILAFVLFLRYRLWDWDGFRPDARCHIVSHAQTEQGERVLYECGDGIAHWKRVEP